MQLDNTKVYYKDLAHYYYTKGRMQLMEFFLGLALDKNNSFSKEDNNDWFKVWLIARPEKDEDGYYV